MLDKQLHGIEIITDISPSWNICFLMGGVLPTLAIQNVYPGCFGSSYTGPLEVQTFWQKRLI